MLASRRNVELHECSENIRSVKNGCYMKNVEIQEEEEEEEGPNTSAVIRQLFASSSAIIASVCFGMTTAFTATFLPQISDMADFEAGSSLASSVVISMVLGVSFCSFSMRFYGRRISQIISNIPWLVGWPCLTFASNTTILLLGCCFVGLAGGFSGCSMTVYTAEITDPKLRGPVAICVSVGVALGILASHLLGILFHWRVAHAISICLPITSLFLALLAPETPNWLILNDRLQEASEIFFRLRGKSKEAELEFNILYAKQEENIKWNNEGICRNIFSRKFFKPFFVLSLMFLVQQGSGCNMVVFYAIDVLKRMSLNIDSTTYMILIDLTRILSTIISAVLVKIMRRRSLFMTSAVATYFSLLAIIYSNYCNLSHHLLIISICAYIWSVYLGITSIPWIMCGEVYPAAVRDVGSGITSIYAFLIIFVVVKLSPLMIVYLNIQFTLGIFACIVLFGSTCLYFIMPETKNATLQQIEDQFSRRI